MRKQIILALVCCASVLAGCQKEMSETKFESGLPASLDVLINLGKGSDVVMTRGIYDYESSTIALTVESILEINYNKSAEVSVYPVEKGLFASYNKVLRPAEVKVEIATGGAYNYLSQSYITWRIAVLKWFEDALNNLTAYDIVMPEKRYSNYTLISYTIRRDKMSGSGLIIADCIFKEVVDMSQLNKTFTERNTNNSNSPNDYDVGAINFISPANFDGVA